MGQKVKGYRRDSRRSPRKEIQGALPRVVFNGRRKVGKSVKVRRRGKRRKNRRSKRWGIAKVKSTLRHGKAPVSVENVSGVGAKNRGIKWQRYGKQNIARNRRRGREREGGMRTARGRGPQGGSTRKSSSGNDVSHEKTYGCSQRRKVERATRVEEWRKAQGAEVNHRERKGDVAMGYVIHGEFRRIQRKKRQRKMSKGSLEEGVSALTVKKPTEAQRERRERRAERQRGVKLRSERVDRGEVRVRRKRRKARRQRLWVGKDGFNEIRVEKERRVATRRSRIRPREGRVGRRRVKRRESSGKNHKARRREFGGLRKGRRGTDRKNKEKRGYGVRVRGPRNGSRRTKEWRVGRRRSSSKNVDRKEWEGVAKTSVGTRGVKVMYKWS